MKLTNLTIATFLAITIIVSCKSANEKPEQGVLGLMGSSENSDTTAIYDPSPSLSTPTSKNVIRKAELRIKVKDVKKSISRYESMAKSVGGFVEYSSIESSEFNSSSKTISEDSLLQVMEYSINGNLTLRVPVFYFDSTVNVIQNSALFLSYRRTSAEDISLQYLSNKMKSEVSEKSGNRIQDASLNKGKKLQDIVNAEQIASNIAGEAIDRKIANFELQQKVNYSSIQINLYQANQVYKETITNINISDYKPAFGERLVFALNSGWNGLLTFFIFILNLWPLFVLFFIIYALIKGKNLLFFKKKNTNQ